MMNVDCYPRFVRRVASVGSGYLLQSRPWWSGGYSGDRAATGSISEAAVFVSSLFRYSGGFVQIADRNQRVVK